MIRISSRSSSKGYAMCKNKALLLFTLVCMVIGLFAALIPFSDIDQDGLWDSLVTEGDILIATFCSALGLFCLRTRFYKICLAAPQQFSFLLLPPPIFN
jgi:hypothetical protein